VIYLNKKDSVKKAKQEIAKLRDAVTQFEKATVSNGLDSEVEMTCNYLFEDIIKAIQTWTFYQTHHDNLD